MNVGSGTFVVRPEDVEDGYLQLLAGSALPILIFPFSPCLGGRNYTLSQLKYAFSIILHPALIQQSDDDCRAARGVCFEMLRRLSWDTLRQGLPYRVRRQRRGRNIAIDTINVLLIVLPSLTVIPRVAWWQMLTGWPVNGQVGLKASETLSWFRSVGVLTA